MKEEGSDTGNSLSLSLFSDLSPSFSLVLTKRMGCQKNDMYTPDTGESHDIMGATGYAESKIPLSGQKVTRL